jgi:hypothetical protein
LNVLSIATVEVTCEDPRYPIERAFDGASEIGWRAATPGPQLICVRFASPTRIRRIYLVFCEPAIERTQEFTLSWAAEDGVFHEILRQQWVFSPKGSNEEWEDYRVDLRSVVALQLAIKPDLNSNSSTIASLQACRLE